MSTRPSKSQSLINADEHLLNDFACAGCVPPTEAPMAAARARRMKGFENLGMRVPDCGLRETLTTILLTLPDGRVSPVSQL